MSDDVLQWMKYSIDVANGMNDSNLHVGAVAVSSENQLICSAFSDKNINWTTKLISSLNNKKFKNVHSLYLTINTLNDNNDFNINELLKEIDINNIYLGVPDPNLTYYSQKDPVITLKNVYRYPDDLQKKILEQNLEYFYTSKQNIRFSPYYSIKRISNLVIYKLRERGINISKEELNSNKQIGELTTYIVEKYGFKWEDTNNIVDAVLSEAFDEKYASYNYSEDARSINTDWKKNFISVCSKLLSDSIEDKKIVDVGVGSGNEAVELFFDCKNMTFVDIAQNGLKKIKRKMPDSNIIVSKAENLSHLSSNSYDMYVSLRTYNSSFFDIKKAIFEAHRVLKQDAIIIVSIANGFLCPEYKYIIPGLIIPGTEFVDIYRGFNMIKEIAIEFAKERFRNIQIFPTNGEIYISAIAK